MNSVEPRINLVLGKNLYRDHLVYELVYNYLQTNNFGFGVVIGNVYPYYKYFSDNMFIKYGEDILSEYLNNMNQLYLKHLKKLKSVKNEENSEIENNLLIIDSDKLDLNTPFWNYFLDNHKMYKTTIIIVSNEINYINTDKIKKYVDEVYMIKTVYNKYKYICKVYETFFKDKVTISMFDKLYDISLRDYLDILHFDVKTDMYSNKMINTDIPRYFFETSKIYNDDEKYSNRTTIRDIINV